MPDHSEKAEVSVKMDLSGVKCPMNFARITVQLSKMEIGNRLQVILDDEESGKNVPASLDMEGHRIIALDELEAHKYCLVVEKCK